MILANHGIISSSGGLPPSTLLTNLYAVYKAENNANDSLGAYNGTAQGGLTYSAGKSGNAFDLNGTNSYVDYVDVLDVGLSSFSYNLWCFPTNLSFSRCLFSKTSWSAGGGRHALRVDSGLLVVYLILNDGKLIEIRDNSTVLNGNQWYNLTVVYDRSDKIKIYVNGVLSTNIGSLGTATNNLIPYASDNLNNSFPFRIGCLSGDGSGSLNPNAFFQGKIDEFCVWNKALTQSEITDLYNSGTGKFYPTF